MPWKNSNFKQEISIPYVNLKESQKKFGVRASRSSSMTLLVRISVSNWQIYEVRPWRRRASLAFRLAICGSQKFVARDTVRSITLDLLELQKTTIPQNNENCLSIRSL